ncbi:MAG: hypothetical protein ACRCWB_11650 [Enterovibrio sp.]
MATIRQQLFINKISASDQQFDGIGAARLLTQILDMYDELEEKDELTAVAVCERMLNSYSDSQIAAYLRTRAYFKRIAKNYPDCEQMLIKLARKNLDKKAGEPKND